MAKKEEVPEKKVDLQKELMKQFKSKFPENPLEVMANSTLAEIPGYITTGNYALNWIISKDMYKGLPMGRTILFSGDAGSGKSLIALSMMREPSIDVIVYFDSEGGGISNDFAEFIGIDSSKILYNPIDTIEELIEKMKLIIDLLEKNKTSKNVLMVIDSISMISTERETDPTGGMDMGNKAKATRVFFRTYARKMQKLNICCVMTAHLTSNIGGYGPSKGVSGGTILEYMPSVEVRFAKVNAESETDKSAIGTSMAKIRANIMKSRLGTHGKQVKFDLDLQYGLDPYAGISDILKDYEFIIPGAADLEGQIEEKKIPKKSSGWWVFKPFDNPATEAMFKKMIDEGLTTSGKFREKDIKKFAKDHDWFLKDIQDMFNSIYAQEEEEAVEAVEPKLILENDTTIAEEITAEIKKEKKVIKKKSAVVITEASA